MLTGAALVTGGGVLPPCFIFSLVSKISLGSRCYFYN